MKKTLLNQLNLNLFKPARLAYMAGEGAFTPEKGDMQEIVDKFQKEAFDKGVETTEQEIDSKYKEAKAKLDLKADQLLGSEDAVNMVNYAEFKTFIGDQMKALEGVKTNYLALRKSNEEGREKKRKAAAEKAQVGLKEAGVDAAGTAGAAKVDAEMESMFGDGKGGSVDVGATEVGTKVDTGTSEELDAMLAGTDGKTE